MPILPDRPGKCTDKNNKIRPQQKTITMRRSILLFTCCTLITTVLAAQRIVGDLALDDPTAIHAVNLKHGQGLLRGRVLALRPDGVSILFHGDTLTLPISSVQAISTLRTHTGEGDFGRAVAASHFLTPTARPLPEHSGYYRNTMILYNEASWQLAPNWTAGISTVYLALGTIASLKYSRPLAPGVYGAVQGRVGVFWPLLPTTFSWSVTPMLTLGDQRYYLTVGLQYSSAGEEFFNDGQRSRSLQFFGAATLTSRNGHRWHLEMIHSQLVNLGWSRYKNRNEFGASLVQVFNLISDPFLFSPEPEAWFPVPLLQYKRYF